MAILVPLKTIKLKTQIKATLLLFTILTILSCSKDGEDTDNSNDLSSTLIKRITENRVGVADFIFNFTYDGNKIVSYTETRDGELNYTTNYIYTNDLITLIQSDRFNNFKTIISYDDNGRVVEENNEFSSNNEFYSYSYSYEYLGNTVKQTDEETCTEITISNNQVSSESYFDEANCTNLEGTLFYSYDENPNAFSNIVGYSWHFSFNLNTNSEYIPAVNNVVDDGDFSWEYDYNENGYPRNVTVYDGDSMSETILIEYY